MKVITLPSFMFFDGFNGLTLWKLVIINSSAIDKARVIRHEAKHVEQWTTIGFFKFPYLYLIELYKVGYWDNKYEVEARNT